jgi:hypothetical protein
MEPRFGHSLSDIRVHVEPDAAAAADSLGATAFTVGRDIAFAKGAYDPGSPSGQFVVAHEVAHAIQNTESNGPQSLRARSGESDASEHDADAAARAVLAGDTASPRAAPSAVVSTYLPPWLLSHPTPMGGAGGAEPAGADRFASPEIPSMLLDRAQSYDSVAEGYNTFGRVTHTTAEALTEQVPQWLPNRLTPSPGNTLFGRKPGTMRELPGGVADAFSVIGGLTDMGIGIDKLANGEIFEGVTETGSGAASTTSGVANLLGKKGLGNVAGGFSSAFSIAGGIEKLTSDDLEEQTEGAQEILANGFDLASSILGGPETPLGAIAAAGGLGARVGSHLVNTSDAIAKERGYFHDQKGNAQSGSAEAADAGRYVNELFGHSNPVLDTLGDGAGLITAGNAAITNAAYTYGRRGVEAVGDGIGDGAEWVGDKIGLSHDKLDWSDIRQNMMATARRPTTK